MRAGAMAATERPAPEEPEPEPAAHSVWVVRSKAWADRPGPAARRAGPVGYQKMGDSVDLTLFTR